ncbi:uncharacterized protein BDV17DRAFT_293933 [Aspergillus undulatus]|uniref:uncharacterized protein n=1 Tax=Aspergillus undulatus TaxID=1810928 RepID=UPI003CCC9ED5
MVLFDFFSNAFTSATTQGERAVNTVINMATPDPEAQNWERHQRLQCRQASRDSITLTFDRLYYSPYAYIDNATAELHSIKIETLTLNTDGQQDTRMPFFKPPSLSWLTIHPINPKHKKTQDRIAEVNDAWAAAKRGEYSECRILATTLGNEFTRYIRIRPDESYRLVPEDRPDLETGYNFDFLNSFPLEEISGWTRSRLPSCIQHHRYIRPTLPERSDKTTPTKTWSSTFGDTWMRNDAKPHLSFIMEHDVPASEDLLATEVMTILGMIHGGLSAFTLEEHKIVPVNVISCLNGYAARVIQAYYRDEELLLYKSKLHFFDRECERQRNINLFLLYLACQPVGDTIA